MYGVLMKNFEYRKTPKSNITERMVLLQYCVGTRAKKEMGIDGFQKIF